MAGVKGRSGGRNRKPTALKLLQGNPGRRPLNDQEPKPALEIPDCPPKLGVEARREWRRIVPELHRVGLLTKIDRAALAAYCVAWGRFIELEAAMRRPVPGTDLDKLIRRSERAMEIMHRYLTEFGMTPASRSRVKVDQVKDGELPEDEAFLSARGLRVVK